MSGIKDWLFARLSEKSTWVGAGVLILTVLTSLGITLPEGVSEGIKTILETIGTIVGTFLVSASTSE